MESLVVYYSEFGNTQKIAEAIADTLSSEGSARAITTDQLKASDLEGLDLLVMGTPTHRMNLPRAVRQVFESLPRGVLAGTPVAAFDTSYKMSGLMARFSAAPKLASRLRKLGGQRLVPPESFHVEAREGPLYAGEVERAQAWATSILQRLEERSR